MIKSFVSEKGSLLVDYLHNLAWDEEIVEQRAKRLQELLQVVQGINRNGKEKELAVQILENFRSGQNISIEQIKRNIKINA